MIQKRLRLENSRKEGEGVDLFDPSGFSHDDDDELDRDRQSRAEILALVNSIGREPCNSIRAAEPSSWTLWQMLDSFFPTGGFAHSLGLEAAVQTGFVHDSSTLVAFISSTLENTAALLLPFVFVSNNLPRIDCWIQMDKILHATLTNQVARKASSSLGAALLRTAATVHADIPELKQMRACGRRPGRVHCHHATVFGVLTGLLALDPLTTQRSFLYLSLRDCLSAATRLNLVGPMEAAAMQFTLSTNAETLLAKYRDRPIEDAFQTAPLLDLFQGYHDNLFSRLFCS